MAMLGLAALASCDAGARETEGAIEPEVTVYLVGGHVAPLPLLAQGKQTATRILAQAGVRLRWVSGTPLPAPDAASARREPSRCARTIILTLAEKAPTDLPPEAFARALPYGGDPGSVTVFYDRIAPVLGAVQFEAGAVFGHVLAHEIIHVLQGVARHSETGVMQAHWRTADYSAMMAGRLRLTAQDVSLIHAGLALAARARRRAVAGSMSSVLSALAIAPAGNK
jgi:hypothetical protein